MDHSLPEPFAPGPRQFMRPALHALAFFFALFVALVQILILAGGTWVIRDSDGAQRLGLSSLSIVQFNGIIPSPTNPDTYLVTMHQFAASFAYEYPSKSKAGIIGSSPHLPYDLGAVSRALALPESEWACYHSAQDPCTGNPFLSAFRHEWLVLPTGTANFAILYALVVVAYLLVTELLIAVRPSWLRCQCYFSCLKRVCPCPRGTRAEIEALPLAFWDRYRAWCWWMLPCTAFLPAFTQGMNGMLLKAYVSRPRGLGDVNARFGTGFVVVQALCLGASVAGAGCMVLRKVLARKRSWMEEQGVGLKRGA
ncbi:hypothetical protein CORC01_14327 [Colletotrichum orchidophilum]|uniref:Uncharacterized protein n=1 Tax=Colletotrichum orchidophilum TaxID=1209926 RepID=A0A1G4AMH7_9PEZI|nr:uncharacterized protein CORC01_14327 [Colletotrichum orchidophilum]OHE90379.1 hypothetical protein CORC01_14327 [Colletotrichum orchidophilum]